MDKVTCWAKNKQTNNPPPFLNCPYNSRFNLKIQMQLLGPKANDVGFHLKEKVNKACRAKVIL